MNETQGGNRSAFGFGVATIASDGSVLDTFFPVLGLGGLDKSKAPDLSGLLQPDSVREVSKQYVELDIDLCTACKCLRCIFEVAFIVTSIS